MILICVCIVLLFTSVYFSARFYLLSKNIRKSTLELREVCKDIERNRRIILQSPNKDMENLLEEVNKYLEITQMEKIKSIRRENEMKTEIESISHDLRTPLTSILGYLELMKDNEISDEERKEYIEIIERKSKALKNLIQSFYDLSRLENNEYKMDIKVVDIYKELMENLLVFYSDFENKKIDVKLDLGEDVVNILGDIKFINRVFVNLIQNAIKYSKSKFGVSLKQDDENIIIIFYNDMENLDDEDVKKIFNRFYMKDNSRNNESSGLGLTITKLLVENMGGSITAQIENDLIYFKIIFQQIK